MADAIELQRLGDRQSLRSYLSDVWDRRAFAVIVPRQDIRVQSMDTVLGQFWHIVNPAMMVGVYYLIFGLLLDARRGVDPYIGFLVIGVVLFQLTQRVVQEASASIARNEGLIRSIQFPRLLLPISVVHAQTFAFVPALGVLFTTLIVVGVTPEIRWLVFVPVMLCQYLLNLGGSFIAARFGHSVRDLDQILPHLFRLLFYVSGVIFSIQQFVTDETLQDLFALNPIYDIVSVARWSLMGTEVDGWIVSGMLLWTLALPVVGLGLFRRAEHRFGS